MHKHDHQDHSQSSASHDDHGHGTATPGKTTRVQRLAGGGAPSDPGVVQPIAERGVAGGGGEVPFRSQMEAGFGTSFANVSFHSGGGASTASREIGADAYTMGNSIAMAATPTPQLVAHELAHVVQQQAGAGPSSGVGAAGDSFEREADHAASAVAGGGTTDLAVRYGAGGGGMNSSIQRRAVQRYESGEHAILGAGPSYPAGAGDTTLTPSGAVVFSGELVAFGDFYSDMQQMASAPRQELEALAGICRLEAVWYRARQLAAQGYGSTASQVGNQVAPGAPGSPGGAPGSAAGADPRAAPAAPHRPDAANLKGLPEITGTHAVWTDATALVGGVQIGQLRQQIFNQFTAVWALFNIGFNINQKPETGVGILRATIGRRRFRGTNDSLPRQGDPNAWHPDGQAPAADPGHLGGDYLDLAQNNLSHFSPDNFAHWQDQHKRACEAHVRATTEQERSMALAQDNFGSHFLTDRFSTGHFVDKAELMSYASQMMVRAARSHVADQQGQSDNQVLATLLRRAVDACFDDPSVSAQWEHGVAEALANHTITAGEARIMRNLPANTSSYSIAGMITGVLMEMPWRQYAQGAGPVEGENAGSFDASRGQGPSSRNSASASAAGGDYQLGVGNLAALQVHDALNAIGFTVQNGKNEQWRCQGDDHLQPRTTEIAHATCQASQDQVRAGNSNPEAIKQFLPRTAWMDPNWIADYFQGQWSTAEIDPGRIASLQALVRGTRIELNIDGGHKGSDDKMTQICHSIMDVLFMPSTASTALEGDHNTGLNISMLKAFLIKRLPEMVSMAYAAASPSDIPQQALELYAPQDASHHTLPRSANNFTWTGDALAFDLNTTGVAPGQYTIVAKCFNKDMDYDTSSSGLPDYSLVGSRTGSDTDAEYARVPIQITAGAQPAGADPSAQTTQRVTVTVPKHGGGMVSRFFHDQGDRYVMITGDPDGACNIGRSNVKSEGDGRVANPSAAGVLPRATGPDHTADSNPNAQHGSGSTGGGAQFVPRPTQIHNTQFMWTQNKVSFRVDIAEPPVDPAGATFDVYLFVMDWELLGADRQLSGPDSVPVTVKQGQTTSEWVEFTSSVSNPGDVYVRVYSGTGTKLGESRVQGTNSGHGDPTAVGPKVATGASDFVWNGKIVRFKVEPADSDPVYVKFATGFEMADLVIPAYAAGSAVTSPDAQLCKVENGACSADASSISHNVSAVVYRDSACTQKIGESQNRTSRWAW